MQAWLIDHDVASYGHIAKLFVDGEPCGDLTRDDILDNITIKDDPVNTWTYGAVVNLWKGVGIFANKSSTWNFSQPAQRVDGVRSAPVRAAESPGLDGNGHGCSSFPRRARGSSRDRAKTASAPAARAPTPRRPPAALTSVATASAEIAQGNSDLSSRTELQAGSLEETASAMATPKSVWARSTSHTLRKSRSSRIRCSQKRLGPKMSRRCVVGSSGKVC